jgi:tripartite-type tricarboxylate transporter receptor subunit TctC
MSPISGVRRRVLGVGFAAAVLSAALAAGGQAQAQTTAPAWPTRPIRVIVPFPPGGGTDVVARILAEQLAPMLGQQVIVENKAGANGNLAAAFVAKSDPDGYTLLFTNTSIMTIAPSVYGNLTFEPLRDFQPIVRVAEVPNLLLVNADVPARSVAELIVLAKPGKMALASGGSGSVSHLTGEMFKLAAGVQMLHVPYKGNAPQIADLVSGQVSAGIADLSGALPQIRAGKLRALAITTKNRSRFLPDVPTLEESGLLTFESSVWVGMVAPAGTPAPAIQALVRAINEIVVRKDVAERISELGFVMVGGTPAEFTARIREEAKHWKEVVAKSGATVE